MIVGQFNTFPYGGAATAAQRLHTRLRKNNVDSRFYYRLCDRPPPADPSIVKLEFSKPRSNSLLGLVGRKIQKRKQRRIYQQYDQHLKDRDPSAEAFAMAQLPEPTKLNWQQIQLDVVHLHWISFLADYPTFFASIPEHVPIVWTLHDMNPLTGGCHYSNGCERFQTGCGDCPQIVAPHKVDVSYDSFRVKQRALIRKNLHVVTPSRWLGDLARQSPIWPAQTTFHVIKLGFDLDTFRPVEKTHARSQLGIDTDAVLIGFGAEDICNKRKGFHHLINCLSNVRSKNPIECLVFGSGDIPDSPELPRMHHFGYVDSQLKQSLIYSAADMVIVPSREDNQPQVGLEAMACGTPVVGFNAGGIAEYVREGISGLLAEIGNEHQLAQRITQLADHPEVCKNMSSRARLIMQDEFDIAKQANKYMSLYADVVSQSQRRSA